MTRLKIVEFAGTFPDVGDLVEVVTSTTDIYRIAEIISPIHTVNPFNGEKSPMYFYAMAEYEGDWFELDITDSDLHDCTAEVIEGLSPHELKEMEDILKDPNEPQLFKDAAYETIKDGDYAKYETFVENYYKGGR